VSALIVRFRHAVAAAALALLPAAVFAAPFVPASDGVVLERLPEKGDPALLQLKRMRSALSANPRDVELAVRVARRALEAARTLGDPRFLGQAQAALGPWWSGDDVAPVALLVRATLKQSQHDFRGALADLDRLLARDPGHDQARLTRATVLAVVGRYADARRDCAAIATRTARLVFAGCDATPASLSGNSGPAYDALERSLASSGSNPGLRQWGLTLAAEIAARRGDFIAAERHFREASVLDPRDAYLKGAYADFLLDRDRPRDVLPMLEAETRNDGLLLRLALAEQRLPERRQAFDRNRADLAARFDGARQRGDRVHLREEARFRLDIEHDGPRALALARDNWSMQREPADLRILIDAARAARDVESLQMAVDWMTSNHVEDVAAGALLEPLQ
jgi:tetratricopeptide (TPR) repeat protein